MLYDHQLGTIMLGSSVALSTAITSILSADSIVGLSIRMGSLFQDRWLENKDRYFRSMLDFSTVLAISKNEFPVLLHDYSTAEAADIGTPSAMRPLRKLLVGLLAKVYENSLENAAALAGLEVSCAEDSISNAVVAVLYDNNTDDEEPDEYLRLTLRLKQM